jgi:pyridoxine kinase
MQLHGFTVNCVNSVQFSNHTGYKNGFKGQVCSGNDVVALIDGLDQNGLLEGYSHMLTGYIGSATFLDAIDGIVDRVKAKNPNLKYVCDPVLGDV